jgi:translocation and assembly module TamB
MALLNGFLPTSQFPLGGTLNGILVRNWDTDSVIGQVAISNPSFGIYQANQFNGQISYTNGIAILTTGVLRRGRTLFQLNGQADLQGSDPQFKGQLAVAQGKLQDLVELAQISDLTDFTQGGSKPSGGRASHLQTVPIDMSQQPVINQLRRLAELQALLAQTEQQKPLLPSLSDLQGRFDGQVSIAGSLKHGISASFNLRGENWVWGPYSAEHIVALGTFENGVLSLRPLRFQSDQSVIAFAGQIGGSQQAGQFRMANVPLSSLSHLMPSMSLDGSLNATATLSGQLLNPQVIGSISLTNASLNGKPIRDAQGNFQYNHARLNFDSQIIAAEPEPILITGTVPLRLPFASISPASDAISLKVNVKNDGLAILNLLNNQVEWVNGKGEVALEVGGTLANPVTTGLIQVQNATLRARALPDPITNVNGRMTLNGDMIAVERLTGQFSQGEIVASGFLPLTKAVPANYPNTADALRIDLNKITLNLKGLYQGVVDGRLVVNGTVFRPQLGGQIALNNGNVLLAGTSSETGSGRTREASSVEFNHLQLTLGNRLRISNYPLLNFVATGHLIINGNLSNPRPQGIIDLKSGQVNLFTTRFNLERGYPQTAEFVENQGLDPILNMRLVALVFDVTGNQLPLSVNSSEILPPNFTGFSSAQSVRIQARVAGPASQLDQNLQLTSSPTRTRTEIVALIGGGFLANLQQGQVGVGLENLVSSVVASDVQSWLANTLGFHDIYFDLFPIITSNQDSRLLGWSSNLNLALEVGVGLTRSLSVNGLKVLTSDQPVQFGLRYRVNDNLFLRGSTDFSGDNRAVLQYEQRF